MSAVLKGISDELVNRELYERALVHLEKLLTLKGPEPDILTKLIICSSKINPSLVQKYSENLPSIEELESQCDVDELTSKSDQFLMNKYNIKKATKGTTQTVEIVASKKRRKKKPRLPKNFDPRVHPNPERWTPKWERSAFKRMKKKKAHDVSKGTQGGTTGDSIYDHSGPKAATTHYTSVESSTGDDTNKVNVGGGARPKTQKLRGGGGGKRR